MCTELRFSRDTSKHILLLPGMLAPVWTLFPLIHYLRQNQNEYGVTAIPLGLSISSFDQILKIASKKVTNLLANSRQEKIILFGHSHGGRIAAELVQLLKVASPNTEFIVITAGSPLVKRPDSLPWYLGILFKISNAYRTWPDVTQPDLSVVSRYFGYYSNQDKIVLPESAKSGYSGKLIELHGISHHGLISSKVMGPLLLKEIQAN